MRVHPAARGFDSAADVYERSRPGYPAGAIDWLTGELDLRPGRTVLDLAAGTGKLSRPLARAGAHVIAVDPSGPMLAALRASLPEADAVEGTAEAIPLPDASVDAVAVAQAFHWFRHPEALAEIHRVLRSGGRLALVANDRDPSDPRHAFMEELLKRYRGDTPRHRELDWRTIVAASGLFEPVAERSYRNDQHLDRGGLVDRVASISFIAALPEDERRRVLAEVERFEEGLDSPAPLPHVTQVLVYARG